MRYEIYSQNLNRMIRGGSCLKLLRDRFCERKQRSKVSNNMKENPDKKTMKKLKVLVLANESR